MTTKPVQYTQFTPLKLWNTGWGQEPLGSSRAGIKARASSSQDWAKGCQCSRKAGVRGAGSEKNAEGLGCREKRGMSSCGELEGASITGGLGGVVPVYVHEHFFATGTR